MTPLVIELMLALRRNPLPYLVALVTAANVGSVAAITGSPQNMLVGISSGISFVEFNAALAPIALAGLRVIWLVMMVRVLESGHAYRDRDVVDRRDVAE